MTSGIARTDDDAEIAFETIGDRADPALLLIGAATWSRDWWDDELCRRLADRGRLVVRYDHRDTGRSTSYPPGSPGYDSTDLTADAVAVLDALGLDRAHVVGLSMGGGIAQRLALEHPDRPTTLTLISTSPIDPTIEALPGMDADILATFTVESPEPDWTDRDAVVTWIVENERPFAGPGSFDEARLRAVAERAFDRTETMASSMSNHFVVADDRPPADLSLARLAGIPTLVLHGTADPMFPPAHGRALAAAIPDAQLVELDDVGHQLPPERTWDVVVDALIEHTARGVS